MEPRARPRGLERANPPENNLQQRLALRVCVLHVVLDMCVHKNRVEITIRGPH